MREYKGKSILIFPDEYIAIDVETTGRVASQCDIIEVSAIRYSDGVQIDSFTSLVDPGYEIDFEISALTGITNEMLYSAPKPENVFPDLYSFIGDAILVGHNVSFDVDFLYDAFEKYCGCYLTNDYVDTLRIAKRVFPGMAHYRLSDVANACGITQCGAHRAEADCVTTANCLAAMQLIASSQRIDLRAAKTKQYPKYENVSPKSIAAETAANPNHPLFNKNIVFTGTLKMPRDEAMQLAANAGAKLKSTVSKKTDYLVVGLQDISLVGATGHSSKERAAEEVNQSGKGNIQIISEDQFLALITASVPESPTIGLMTEENVFDVLSPKLLEVIAQNNANPEKLILKKGEKYSSVWIDTQMAFRICCRDDKYYFGVSARYFDIAPDSIKAAATKYKEGADYQNLYFLPTSDSVMMFSDFLGTIMDTTIDSITKEYSCCSRIEECSLAGKCVSPYPNIAMLCGYRKVMKSGRIFYGPNRNID